MNRSELNKFNYSFKYYILKNCPLCIIASVKKKGYKEFIRFSAFGFAGD